LGRVRADTAESDDSAEEDADEGVGGRVERFLRGDKEKLVQ
jgi:hypothetical protein